MERKVGSGRKGTVDEEEYLLRSLTKLVARWTTVKVDATHLLPHLFQFNTQEHRAEGLSLQAEVAEFANELQAAIEEVWTKTALPPQSGEGEQPSLAGMSAAMDGMQEGWAKRMREYELAARLDPLDKVAKPEVGKLEWRQRLSNV